MDKRTCPICGNENNCAIANGKNPEECWCMNVSFPKEFSENIPEDKKGESCVCLDCLNKIKSEIEKSNK